MAEPVDRGDMDWGILAVHETDPLLIGGLLVALVLLTIFWYLVRPRL